MQLDGQLADRNVKIELSDAALDWLADRGYDQTGASVGCVVHEHCGR